ncbi:hypothetical protein [Aliidiomarina haloalkalitolerans]|uniref:Uncharacterized protein n=1 Tax=Aliidiomarina haloalkalitolerans TaxID=859059 RepID=A0A432VYF6_9GAMM|nr:hypothetical protein [Aliidiomarina haloalkalitolerans]MCL4409803.1 hypothetical protein [Gammaproteobacteria bacterium]RUO21625.1 hypothetical protein CWE06_01865 [Aliidiomarina haloalkalitolerans]
MARHLLLLTLLSWLSLPSASAAHDSAWEQVGGKQLSALHTALTSECFTPSEQETEDYDETLPASERKSVAVVVDQLFTTSTGYANNQYSDNTIRGPPQLS